MSDPWIEIEIQFMAEFRVSDLWPDGDAPDPITKDDVWELINRENIRRLADEWFFPIPDVFVRLIDPRQGVGFANAESIPREVSQ